MCVPVLTRAQEPYREREARALFEAGQEAYMQADFEGALQSFQRAYELSQRRELLFNCAQAADRMREDHVALEYYRRFLNGAPESEPRRVAESRVEFLTRLEEEANDTSSEARTT
ncbi:MAG: hypothetical protein KC492_16535, partial [Myxococcales bacterium]|nr:hypothetical protein [Myxococcales bacterium]